MMIKHTHHHTPPLPFPWSTCCGGLVAIMPGPLKPPSASLCGCCLAACWSMAASSSTGTSCTCRSTSHRATPPQAGRQAGTMSSPPPPAAACPPPHSPTSMGVGPPWSPSLPGPLSSPSCIPHTIRQPPTDQPAPSPGHSLSASSTNSHSRFPSSHLRRLLLPLLVLLLVVWPSQLEHCVCPCIAPWLLLASATAGRRRRLGPTLQQQHQSVSQSVRDQ